MRTLKTMALRIAFLSLLSYGFLYFSYKWLNPMLYEDFQRYYPIYLHPLHFHAALSPWVYRQLNAIIVHGLWRAHIFYPNLIAFHDPRYDQRIFFAALVSNYLALLIAALLTTLVMDDRLGARKGWLSLISAVLCFFTFQLQSTLLTGQADGWSWALLALAYLFYTRRQTTAFILALALSIFQREVLPLAFLAIALTELWQLRRKKLPSTFQLHAATASALIFAAYMLMRTFLFPAPGNEEQSSLHQQFHHLFTFRPDGDFFFEAFLTQNLMLLLAVLYLLHYKRHRELSPMLWPLLSAAALWLAVSISSHINNSAGRILGLLTPIVCIEIASVIIRGQLLTWTHTTPTPTTTKPIPQDLFATGEAPPHTP